MRCVKFFVIIILLSLLVMPANAQSLFKTDTQIKSIAEPIIDNILKGLKMDDYAVYSKDFEESLKVAGARNKFYEINRYVQNSLGNYLYRQYMGSVRKGDSIVVLWKGAFDKTPDDILIKLVITKKQNKYRVTGVWLQ